MYRFEYHQPTTIDEASELFSQADDGMYLSGGMTLIPTMKQRLAAPTDVIDLSGVVEMSGIALNAGRLRVGALTRHNDLATSDLVTGHLPVLSALAASIGDNQVRNRGTIGGSVANSDPAADYPAAVIGLGADVVTDQRVIAGDDFFKNLFETALNPGEIVMRVDFPQPSRAVYQKFPNPASRYAVVGVLIADFGGTIRVGVTGAGPCAFRASVIEEVLNADLSVRALEHLVVPDAGFNSDLHASAEYRAHLVKIMTQRAVAKLLEH
ncbi:MAG: xanthine dehydrogenase family protein subunit M [Pseudomonadota bacterium]